MSYASEKRRLERKHQAEEAAARIEAVREQIGQKGAKDWGLCGITCGNQHDRAN